MRSRVQLFEHETVRVGEPLRAAEGPPHVFAQRDLDALARFNDRNRGRYFRLGYRSLTARAHVGYLEVGDLSIEILPKADRLRVGEEPRAWRDGLLEMLQVATNLRLETPSIASQDVARTSLLEILGARFVTELEELLHQGLAKGYRDEEANGAAFRGRLLVAENLRENLVRRDRFYVRYSTFDADTALNRVLRAALEVLQARAISGALSGRAAACALRFPSVATVRVAPGAIDRIVLGRSTVRYSNALVLARLLLEHLDPSLQAGAAPVFALLFDMNVLWERYIGSVFRTVAGHRFRVSTQDARSFFRDERGSRTIRPDIVVRAVADDRVLLVADTKWRVLKDGKPTDDELKQMFAYNELFGAPRSLLVYPDTGSGAGFDGRFEGREHSCAALRLGVVSGGWRADVIREGVAAMMDRLE